MPLLNLRSLIEILIPGDTGSSIADYLFQPVGIAQSGAPLFYVLVPLLIAVWWMRRDKKVFMYVLGAVIFIGFWTSSTSKYSHKTLPYTVPVDKADPNQAASVADTDYSPDGTRVAQDDYARIDNLGPGHRIVDWHVNPIPGKVTQEEANYQRLLCMQAAQQVLDNVESADQWNSTTCYEVRDYLRAREAAEQAVAPLHNGGFWDRVKYRWAIDENNAKPSPIQKFEDVRDHDHSMVTLWLVLPVLGLIVLGLLAKRHYQQREAEETTTAKSRWESLVESYTRARVIKTGLPIDGPIFLRYPLLFINDTPFKLDQASIEHDHKNVIVLRDGTKLHLYQGEVQSTYVQEAPARKQRPKWNIEDTEALS